MKFRKLTTFHKELAKKLGNDLVYSMALDDGKIYVAVSVHKSKTKKYKDASKQKTCMIKEEDLDKDISKIVSEIKKLYDTLLMEKPNESIR